MKEIGVPKSPSGLYNKRFSECKVGILLRWLRQQCSCHTGLKYICLYSKQNLKVRPGGDYYLYHSRRLSQKHPWIEPTHPV